MITNYSDNLEHASFIDANGFVDEGGEEYNGCIHLWYHEAFSDPVCVDYRIGTEYNTLTFKYTADPSNYSDSMDSHFRIIDKDSFDVLYDCDTIVKGQTGEAVIDVSEHKNIRIQLVATKGSCYVAIKDVLLSNKEQ